MVEILLAERKRPMDPVLDNGLGQGVFENPTDGVSFGVMWMLLHRLFILFLSVAVTILAMTVVRSIVLEKGDRGNQHRARTVGR